MTSSTAGSVSGKQSQGFSKFLANTIDNILGEPENNIPLEQIAIKAPSGFDVKVGDRILLSKKLTPSNSSNQAIDYVSSDQKVAITNAYGAVLFLKEGTVTISAKDNTGIISNALTFQVTNVEEDDFLVSYPSTNLYVGSEFYLDCVFSPTNTTIQDLTYECSDNSILNVDHNGFIKALKVGTAQVTISSKKVTKHLTFTIHDKTSLILPQEIILSINNDNLLYVGESLTMENQFLPSDTSDKTLVYTSSNEKVLSVNQNGTIVAHRMGEATIVATSLLDNSVKGNITIKVMNILPDSLVISNLTSQITNGESLTLKVLADIKATYQSLKFSSSDPSIASINQAGVITTHQAGNVTIKVTCDDNDSEKVETSFELTILRKSNIEDFETFQARTRKVFGHFLLFVVLGFTGMICYLGWLTQKWLPYFLNLGVGIFIASLSEFIQLFTPDRGGMIKDVLIDSSGLILPIIIFVMIKLFKEVIKKKTNPK